MDDKPIRFYRLSGSSNRYIEFNYKNYTITVGPLSIDDSPTVTSIYIHDTLLNIEYPNVNFKSIDQAIEFIDNLIQPHKQETFTLHDVWGFATMHENINPDGYKKESFMHVNWWLDAFKRFNGLK